MPYRATCHTHTYRCHHASGDVADYAAVAAAGGCRVLGMSDHAPTVDGRWPEWRMALAELDGYEAAVRAARRDFPGMAILLGLECEWTPEFDAFQRDELLGRRGYDYLIGSCHVTVVGGRELSSFSGLLDAAGLAAYARTVVRTMESGLFAFIAHPDAFGNGYVRWDADAVACARDIATAAAQLGVALELNGYGLRKETVVGEHGVRAPYPWPPFWEVAAACGARVVLNSDAHAPEDTLANWDELDALRRACALTEVLPDVAGARGTRVRFVPVDGAAPIAGVPARR
jgi:histidinol-phosphatase (PHP family)